MDMFENLPNEVLEYSDSGKLIVLDNPDTIYILKQGDMDLFLVEFNEQKQATNRVYCGSLSKIGVSLIRGIEPNDKSRLKLCAIAHLDSSYLEVPKSAFPYLSGADQESLIEQLNVFFTSLIKVFAPNIELYSDNLPILFSKNSDELYALFENFVAEKNIYFKNQCKHLKDEAAASHKRAHANLFSLFHKNNRLSFEENKNTLVGAMQALGKIQEIDFVIEGFDEYPDEDATLENICRQSMLRRRNITLEIDWQHKSGIPFLGKLNTGENVAVFNPEDDESGWYWYNSASNDINQVDDSFMEKLSNKGVIFYKPLPNEPIGLKKLLLIMWKLANFDIKRAFLLFFIASLLSSSIPVINAVIFSTVIPMADYQLLMQMFVLASGFILTKGVIEYLNLLLLLRIRTKVGWALQSGLWDRLLTVPLSFFKQYSIGDMTSRSLGIMELVTIFSNTFLRNVLTWVFSFPAIILMFYYSPIYGTVMFLFISFVLFCFGICAFISYGLQKKITELSGEIQGNIIQYFAGISKIRASKTEHQALEHWSEKFAKQRELQLKLLNYNKITNTISAALPICTITIMIGLTAFIFKINPEKMLSAPDLIAFSAALSIVSATLGMMLTSFNQAIVAVPIYQRLKPILETPGEVHLGQSQAGEITGNISIKHLVFKYDTLQRAILYNVSLQVKPGQFVAIVGESGSGKSTLLRLLLGFDKPIQGSISYDDVDLNQINLSQLRSQIGVVLQDGKLLPDSIYRNIVAGSASLSVEDAWDAAKMVGLTRDIKAMPMQMHTIISGESGGVSGGQRQRILLARALVRKPKILFLDEATSAMDNRSQSIVGETLAKLKITKVIIAHRLSTIVDADIIVVLDKGNIVEQGTYDELMKLDGFFAKQARRQLIEDEG